MSETPKIVRAPPLAPVPLSNPYWNRTPRRRGKRHPNVTVITVLVVLSSVGGSALYFLLTSHDLRHSSPASYVAPVLPTPIQHVIVVFVGGNAGGQLVANASSSQSKQAPYEANLAEQYAYAGHFSGLSSYAYYDYLYATSGVDSQNTLSIAQLIDHDGESWAVYSENMTTPCNTSGAQNYSSIYDPFLTYNYVTQNPQYCADHILTFADWDDALTHDALPNYVWIQPTLPVQRGADNLSMVDDWLSGFLAPVVSAPAFSSSAVFVAYASNQTSPQPNGTGLVYLTAISPYAHFDYTSNAPYNDYDLLTTTEWLLDLGHTGHNDNWANAPPMTDLFDFAPTYEVLGKVSYPAVLPMSSVTVAGDGYSVPVTNGTFSLRLPNGQYTFEAYSLGCTSRPVPLVVAGANQSLMGLGLTCSVAFHPQSTGDEPPWIMDARSR